MYHELFMSCLARSSSTRGTPTSGPNSPREIGLGEVMPRAIQPEIASKSNVRQTMGRGMSRRFPRDAEVYNAPGYAFGRFPPGWHNSALPRRKPDAMTSRDYSLDSFWMPFTANRGFKKL